mgnify:CR=1 FL=1
MRLLIAFTLVVACGDEVPNVAPVPPGTTANRTTPESAVDPAAPAAPTTPGPHPAGQFLSCTTPDGQCIQCVAGAACYSPTMETSCRTRGEFASAECSLEGAIGRCTRPDTAVVISYGGPPRNHRPEIMQALCENGFRGVFEAL